MQERRRGAFASGLLEEISKLGSLTKMAIAIPKPPTAPKQSFPVPYRASPKAVIRPSAIKAKPVVKTPAAGRGGKGGGGGKIDWWKRRGFEGTGSYGMRLLKGVSASKMPGQRQTLSGKKVTQTRQPRPEMRAAPKAVVSSTSAKKPRPNLRPAPGSKAHAGQQARMFGIPSSAMGSQKIVRTPVQSPPPPRVGGIPSSAPQSVRGGSGGAMQVAQKMQQRASVPVQPPMQSTTPQGPTKR